MTNKKKTGPNRENNMILDPEQVKAIVRENKIIIETAGGGRIHTIPVSAIQLLPHMYFSLGNTKTGKTVSYAAGINETCDHGAECLKTGNCYAMGGRFLMPVVVYQLAHNALWLSVHTENEIVAELLRIIDELKPEQFRPYVAGDFDSVKTARAVLRAALARPAVHFGGYTKRPVYMDFALDSLGLDHMPENYPLKKSAWTDENGNFIIPYSRHEYPIAYFIPRRHPEILRRIVAAICPATRGVKIQCSDCGICYRTGRNVAFLEHSTKDARRLPDVFREYLAGLK